MDTSAGRRRAHVTIQSTRAETAYSHDVNMYRIYPDNKICLTEFEELAVERLELLRILERATLKGYKLFSKEWKKGIKEELAKLGLKRYLRLLAGYNGNSEQDIQARRADYLSHFILRIAYCRSEDLRRWFINREMEWFKLKFLAQSSQAIFKFLQLNNFTFTPIPVEVKEKIHQDLINCTPDINEANINSTDFFKIPFTEVVSLVKQRKVFLGNGYAFVPTSELIVTIQSQFRASLSASLTLLSHKIPLLDDTRIGLLDSLNHVHTGERYDNEKLPDEIDLAHLDSYSKKHFPLCMKNLYDQLKSAHHLKHQGRLQLLLFLKGIGLSYELAFELWRSEFTKNPQIDDKKFDKQYSYTVRHSYGKAGGMTNYSPYSCIKIIMNPVGTDEYHGCPFKEWNSNILKHKLTEQGLNTTNVNSIIELVSGHHYQIACTKYFECTNNQASITAINHPNQYFKESLNLTKDKSTNKRNQIVST